MTEPIFQIAERLKRHSRNSDILALCDYALSPKPEPKLVAAPVNGECPACVLRRARKTAQMRKYRAGKR